VTYGNGVYLSAQARHDLAALGHDVRIVDLRWLAPLGEAALLAACADVGAVLIVDECRRTGSQSEALMSLFHEKTTHKVARLTAEDSFIATGPAYAATLPSRAGIVAAAQALLE
jgi:2-oxoisovalerate dehydrogenase E1 component